jgi:hypothetical protein
MAFTEDWYPAEQLDLLAKLAGSVAVRGHCIEVGVWEGRSALTIARAIAPEALCAVDTWAGNQEEQAVLGVAHPSVDAAKQRDVLAAFRENIAEARLENIHVFQMDWRELLTRLYPQGGTPDSQGIAFLHLDASHDYESVYQQIHTFYPYMLPGSIMCGDDFANASAGRIDLNGGVERAVRNFFGYKTRNNGNLWWANL